MATPIINLPEWAPSADGADLLALQDSSGAAVQASLSSVESKRLGYFNVLDYGADTAAADNSVAFQAAIDAAATNRGGVVWVPPTGEFKFTAGIQMHGRGVRLMGAAGVGESTVNGLGLRFSQTGEPCIRIGSNGDGRYLTGGGVENLRLTQYNGSAVDAHVICFGEHNTSPIPAASTASPAGSRCRFLNLRIGSNSKDCAAIFSNNGNMTENLFQNLDIYHAPGAADGVSLIHLEGHDIPNSNQFTNFRITDSRNYAIRLRGQTGSQPTGNMFSNIDIENGKNGGMLIGGAIGTMISNVSLYDTTSMTNHYIYITTGYDGPSAPTRNTTILNCTNQNLDAGFPVDKYFIFLNSGDAFVAGCGQNYNDTIRTTIKVGTNSRSHIFMNPTVLIDNDRPDQNMEYYNYGPNASQLRYDNTTSGLTATTVQAAIDELAP